MIWLALVGVDRPGELMWFFYQHLYPHLRRGYYIRDLAGAPSQGGPP